MIIEIGNEKGGVGKSTIAINLAAYLSDQKYSVVLVDTDTTMSASKWGARRSDFGREHHFTIVDKAVDPTEHIRKLSEKYDVVVVDVGARDYARLSELARIVDLWIAPTGVGQKELESTLELADAFQKATHLHKRGKIPLAIAINSVPTQGNSSEGTDALEALKEALPDVAILPTMLFNRKVWRDADKLGKSIFEMPLRAREKAEEEFTQMIKEALRAYEGFIKEEKKHG